MAIVADGGRNDLSLGLGRGVNLDAWGRQKAITDFSLLHGMFTFNVARAVWKEIRNGVEDITSYVNATSLNGKLHLVSGATLNDDTILRTYRNPRYEPNRGHLYSVSLFLPSPTAAGERNFGMFTEESGVFFRLKSDGNLYGVVRTTVNTVTTDTETLIPLPFEIDLEKGNIFDIQMQWRGVGAISFYVGNPNTQTSQRVLTLPFLGSLDELSLFNPALPISYQCINNGAEVTMESGCVDVTTEGGSNYDGTYGAIATSSNSGSVAVTGYNALVLAVHSKETYLGRVNTRDVLNLALNAYADQRAVVRVWITRDGTAITLGTQTYVDYRDGNLEYVEYDPAAGTPASFDTTKAELQFSVRVNMDETFTSDAVFSKAASLNITPGDYLIFTIHRENGLSANVGITYEFSEEI